ncbi:hypothetical protein BGZ99_002215 [Dissophora globulifera]|uniref:NmrA-like domain-containing protein n=1 Tax=Dissophora globulifera TaxID=979702 RepID=A0A9P6R0U4_9FUNG|nr:hypothetical protein BGZ99_002215 [Dissophora globulifera]
MSKLLVVFGATGQQGGSVINYVVNDPELSKIFKIRGITRDPSAANAQALLQKGVEVVKGDANDHESLKQALQGAHTVFIVTVTVYDALLKPRELAQGKAIADTAVDAGAQYLIFSTLPYVTDITKGVCSTVPSFDVKAEIEEYIRTLPIKSAFFSPGIFMQNYVTMAAPHPAGDGTYSLTSVVSPTTRLPLIDVAEDTGKYIGAILAEPDKYEGKVFSAATRFYTYDEIAQELSKATGKIVKYHQLPVEVFKSFLPPGSGDTVVGMMQYIQDVGYYGPQGAELVEWSAQNARGKLPTFDEFLARQKYTLQ